MAVTFTNAATLGSSTGAQPERKSGTFIGRALSIRSRRKQYANNAESIDDKHAKAGIKKQSSLDKVATFMSFGTRTKKYAGIAQHATSAIVDLKEIMQQAAAGDPPLCDLSAHRQFLVLTSVKKNGILNELARCTRLQAVVLHQLALDNSNAGAIAAILAANQNLGLFSVERNNLKEAGLLEVAKAASGHKTLRELRVGEQQESLSTAATIALVEVMESTPSLIKLGVGTIRDDLLLKRLEAATMHNKDLVRQKRIAAGGDEPEPAWVALWEAKTNAAKGAVAKGAAPRKNTMSSGLASKAAVVNANVATTHGAMKSTDWLEEARRLRANEAPQFGGGTTGDTSPQGKSPGAAAGENGASYVLTGDGAWLRSKDDQKLAIVGAFAANTSIKTAGFANCAIGEELGALWGEVLQRNRTLTSLSLESNTLQTESIEAIAIALKGTPALRELRLANQHKNFSQASESTLADAIEANHRLTKLTVDLRSTNARDRIAKALDRNQREAREAKKSGGEVPFGPVTATGPLPGMPNQGPAGQASGDAEGGATSLDFGVTLGKAKGPQKKRAKGKTGGARPPVEQVAESLTEALPSGGLYADLSTPEAAPAPASSAAGRTASVVTEVRGVTSTVAVEEASTRGVTSVVAVEEPRLSAAPLPPPPMEASSVAAPKPASEETKPVEPEQSKAGCCIVM